MKLETQEAIQSLHYRIGKRIESAKMAQEDTADVLQKVMLAGKIKAYSEIKCLIQDRYGRKVEL